MSIPKNYKRRRYEILRFEVSGFGLNAFVKEDFMLLSYVNHCFNTTLF